MSSKGKQKVIINNVPYGTGSIGMSDSTFKEMPVNMKRNGTKLDTLSYLRTCVQNGECQGNFTIGNKSGYLFKYQDSNVLVDKDVRTILAAYKDQIESPIHICKPKINKKSIKPLEVVNNGRMITVGGNTFNLDDIIIESHFHIRIRQRFFITDEKCIRQFMEDVILNGEYLGVTKDKDFEKDAHLFSKRGIAVLISLDFKQTVTVYEMERKINKKPREFAKNIFQRRINTLKDDERKLKNRYELFSLKANKQIAEYELLKYRARSQVMKMSYQSYIDALEETKGQYKTEYLEKAKETNEFTKSLIAFT